MGRGNGSQANHGLSNEILIAALPYYRTGADPENTVLSYRKWASLRRQSAYL